MLGLGGGDELRQEIKKRLCVGGYVTVRLLYEQP